MSTRPALTKDVRQSYALFAGLLHTKTFNMMMCLLLVAFLPGCFSFVPCPITHHASHRDLRVHASPSGSFASSSRPETPVDGLRRHFENHMKDHMKDPKVALFKDWETYNSTLPHRLIGGKHYALSSLPYFGMDLERIGQQLLDDDDSEHRKVAYFVAPTQSGKTSSMLPIFLATLKTDDEKREGIHALRVRPLQQQ